MLLLSSVSAFIPPSYTSRKPYQIILYKGKYLCGNVNSLRYANDGDVYGVKGKEYQVGPWPWQTAFQVDFTALLEDPGSGYTNNGVTVRFRFVGYMSNLLIKIYYWGSGQQTELESPTGGSYVQKTYSVGEKRVYAVEFIASELYSWYTPYVYVDYVIATYEA